MGTPARLKGSPEATGGEKGSEGLHVELGFCGGFQLRRTGCLCRGASGELDLWGSAGESGGTPARPKQLKLTGIKLIGYNFKIINWSSVAWAQLISGAPQWLPKSPEKTTPEEGRVCPTEQALPLGQQWVRVPRARTESRRQGGSAYCTHRVGPGLGQPPG